MVVIMPKPKSSILEIKNFVADHVEIKRDGVLTVEGRSFNDVVLAFCRFFDVSPKVVGETCTIIQPEYDKLLATNGPTND